MNKPLEKINIIPERETALAVMTPLSMLDRAVASGASIEVLERLMAMHERMEQTKARQAFDAAIADAKAEIKPVVRNATGHNAKKYADFAAIAMAVDPIISKHGLSYRFRSSQTDKIAVTCILSHKAGHFEETTLSGPADGTGSKNAIQAIGSTLTYLQRYSLVQALGLAASNDDDGKLASNVERITQDQADNLRDLIEANGKERGAFLKWAKQERIEDIAADQYEACVKAITFKPTKA